MPRLFPRRRRSSKTPWRSSGDAEEPISDRLARVGEGPALERSELATRFGDPALLGLGPFGLRRSPELELTN